MTIRYFFPIDVSLLQVWLLNQFYSVDFSKSRASAFSKNAQSRFASVVDSVLGPPRMRATPDGVLVSL